MELNARYGLGDDPYDPRGNIFAGAAYLREMHDRFGTTGFLAAYNAGPARYADYLETGNPLPRETELYLAKLAPVAAGMKAEGTSVSARDTQSWKKAPLFVTKVNGRSADDPTGTGEQAEHSLMMVPGAGRPPGDPLFVPTSP